MDRSKGTNAFEFVVIAGARAKQLIRGCTPRTTGNEKLRRGGLISRLQRHPLDLALSNFFLSELDELLVAGRPRRAAANQLLGTRAGDHHELECVGSLRSIHYLSVLSKVSTMRSARGLTERSLARSAVTMA